MKARLSLAFGSLLLISVSMLSAAQRQTSNPIIGAWKIAEILSPPAFATKSPQPSLYLFTTKYYSLVNITGANVRNEQIGDQSSDADKLAAWAQYTAHSGSYELSNNELTLHQVVAKNPSSMKSGSFVKFAVSFDHDMVTLTQKSNQAGAINGGLSVRLARLE